MNLAKKGVHRKNAGKTRMWQKQTVTVFETLIKVFSAKLSNKIILIKIQHEFMKLITTYIIPKLGDRRCLDLDGLWQQQNIIYRVTYYYKSHNKLIFEHSKVKYLKHQCNHEFNMNNVNKNKLFLSKFTFTSF